MNSKKTVIIIAAVEAVAAILMYFVVTTISPVCNGMLELVSGKQVHMKCWYAATVFVFIAVLLLINAILSMAVKPGIVSGVMTMVIAALVFVTLNDSIGIGICANPEMACQMTAPYVKVCAVIEIICGAAHTFLTSKMDK